MKPSLSDEFLAYLAEKQRSLKSFRDSGTPDDTVIWEDPAPIGKGRYATGAWREPKEKYPMDKDVGINYLPFQQLSKRATINEILAKILGRNTK